MSFVGACRYGFGSPPSSVVRPWFLATLAKKILAHDSLTEQTKRASTPASPARSSAASIPDHSLTEQTKRASTRKTSTSRTPSLPASSTTQQPSQMTILWSGRLFDARTRQVCDSAVTPDLGVQDWPGKFKRQFYYDMLANSTFVLAPRGDSRWSYRFFESLGAAAVPLVISDGLQPPFEHSIPWWRPTTTTSKISPEYQLFWQMRTIFATHPT